MPTLHRISGISDRILFGLFFLVVLSMIAEYGFYLHEAATAWINTTSVVVVWFFVVDYVIKLITDATTSVVLKSRSHLKRHLLGKWPRMILSLLIILQNLVFFKRLDLHFAAEVDYAVWVRLYFAATQTIIFIGFLVPLLRYSTRLAAARFHPSQSLVLGFLILISIGTAALLLPKAVPPGKELLLLDALFTATSSVCVTGLTVVDTASNFSTTGHVIILVLIQLGGIGIIAFATFFAMFFGAGISVKERVMVQDVLNETTYEDAMKTLRQIIIITAMFEVAGAISLYSLWPHASDVTPWKTEIEKAWFAIFHSVSAFCNAGFTLTSNTLTISNHWTPNFVLAFLIVGGGLGFSVIRNLISYGYARTIGRLLTTARQFFMTYRLQKPQIAYSPERRFKDLQAILDNYKAEMSVQSKFVLAVSSALLVAGTLSIVCLEWDKALGASNVLTKWLHALFMSISARTAGFNTLDMANLATPTIMVFILLMFIGASPGSTGGGIKTTTFATMIISSFGNLSARERLHVFKRQIPHVTVVRALMVVTFSTLFLFCSVFVLSITEPGMAIDKLVFEAVSAFATVGLSLGVTSSLSVVGKMIIILSMFVGRLGTLSIAMSVTTPKSSQKIYPEESIMIG